jgi:catechol 2,3-dioxygenase
VTDTAPAREPHVDRPQVDEPHVQELGHLVLYVSDLARSVEFYEHVLGWHKLPQPVGMPAAAFSGGRTHHELLLIEVGPGATPIPPGRRVGLYHFGLKVGGSDDELRAMLARVRQRPDLVRLVGATNHHVTHSLYVVDPDGNEIELYIDVPGADWRADPSLLLKPGEPLSL